MPPRGPKAHTKDSEGVIQKALKVKQTAGAKASHGPDKTGEVKELEERRRQMKEQLQQVEVQIYKLESQYIEQANPRGNALKGYDGLLSSVAASAKKAALKQEDRIFSASSVSGDIEPPVRRKGV